MKVVDRLAAREQDWRELQLLLYRLENRRIRKVDPAEVIRLGELYRSSCADLMLAEAHDLPRETVAYLHALVGRAHNAVYRGRGFRLGDWGRVIFEEVPRRLRSDPMLRVAALTFWGLFFLTAFLAAAQPGFAGRVAGEGRSRRWSGCTRARSTARPTTGSTGMTRRWPASTSSTTPGSA